MLGDWHLILIICQNCWEHVVARYEDGKYLKKRNTFTDFVAVAEHLIAHKYTSPAKLCIEVRSSQSPTAAIGAFDINIWLLGWVDRLLY